jgi:hypothetical protein
MFRRRARIGLALFGLAVATIGCAKGEGVARVEVILPESLERLNGPGMVVARVEQRANKNVRGPILGVSEAVPVDPAAGTLELPRFEIPHGSERVVIVEISRARDGSVAYYGTSEPFDFRPGDEIAIEVPVLSALFDPIVTIDSTSNGRVKTVDVVLLLDAGDAVEAHVSNDVTFGASSTQTFRTEQLPVEASLRRIPWSLDFGLSAGASCGISDYCPRQVFVRLVDAAGYLSAVATATVVVDTRAPSLFGDPFPARFMPAWDARREVTRAAPGTLVTVSFTLSEPASEPPVVIARGTTDELSFEPCRTTGVLSHECDLDFPDRSISDQTFQVLGSVSDLAGNRETLEVALPFESDRTSAAPPDTETESRIVYERAPWGREGGPPRFAVSGSTGAVQRGTTIMVLDDPDLSRAHIVGLSSSAVSLDGSFGVVELSRLDRDRVWLVAIDEAGNASAPSFVRDVRWIGAIGTSELGTAVNPHELELAPSFAERVLRPSPSTARIVRDARSLRQADGTTISAIGASLWTERTRDLLPALPRSNHSMTYDRERGRSIVFGGFGGDLVPLAGTREWDGSLWVLPAPGVEEPEPRFGAALVYHAASARSVLFGGSGGARLGDTWTWDGRSWARTTPLMSPSARLNHAMAYDSVRGRTVLFSGDADGGRPIDTWEWDGAEWKKTLERGPPEREYSAMAFDRRRGRVVLFGGTGLELLSDTWEYDGERWTNVTPVSTPSPRARRNHVMVFDEEREAVIVIGGAFVDPNGRIEPLEDAWEWVSQNGTMVWRPLPALSGAIGRRIASAAAYDAARRRVLVFGGGGTTGPIDELVSIGPDMLEVVLFTTSRPPPLHHAALAFDEASRRTILFGGNTGAAASWTSETWAWNGSSWTELSTSDPPPPLEDPRFASGPGELTLFGVDRATREIQVWGFSGSSWSRRDPSPAARPEVRFGSAVAYDDATGEAVLFGGYRFTGGLQQGLADTHAWTGTEWIERSPLLSPSARYFHALAADPDRDRLILFGGIDDSVSPPFSGELWEWDGRTASWIGPLGSRGGPSGRHSTAIAFDSLRSRILIHGGSDNSTQADVWEWLGAAARWQQVETLSRPSARAAHAIAYEPDRKVIVAYGGCPQVSCLDSVRPLQDTWELSRDPLDRPAVLVSFDWGSAHAPRDLIRSLSVTALIGGRGYDPSGSATSERYGAELMAWNARSGDWTPIATTSTQTRGLESVEASTSTASDAQRIVDAAGKIRFAVASSPRTGRGSSPPVATIDEIQVEVVYRAPVPP